MAQRSVLSCPVNARVISCPLPGTRPAVIAVRRPCCHRRANRLSNQLCIPSSSQNRRYDGDVTQSALQFVLVITPVAIFILSTRYANALRNFSDGLSQTALLQRTTQNMIASYIPHLDGIRALALLGVLLFHFDVGPFTGGYTGVDIFLTLSGFLITRNIGLSLHSKTGFSLRTFYIRRFFRLYPASLACTFVAAFLSFAMFPPELTLPTLRSALASLASVSNVYFYLTTGYFDLDARQKPLLHHWSLSLEEQFYLIWPPLLLLVSRYTARHHLRAVLSSVLLLLTLSSFALAVTLSHHFASFTFFLLPTRVFQFAIGALYAVAHWKHDLHSNVTRFPTKRDRSETSISSLKFLSTSRGWVVAEAVSILSVSTIIMAYVLLPPGAPPMLVAPVSLATLGLIVFPETLVAARVLAHPTVALVGRLSYSAYLVHWPIYVFLRFAAPALHLPLPSALQYTTVTFLVALVLHHGIEQPLRRPQAIHKFFMLALTGLTVAFCAFGIRSLGFRWRSQEYFYTGFPASEMEKYYSHEMGVDVTSDVTNRTDGIVFRVGAVEKGVRSKFVVFGDSFTAHLRTGMHVVGKRRNLWFQMHSTPGCQLWPDHYYDQSRRPDHPCRKQIRQMWQEIEMLPNKSTILLANLWCNEPVEAFKRLVYEISDMVMKIGEHKLVIVGEPPGLSENARLYFPCASFWQLPIGRLMRLIAQRVTDGRYGKSLDGTSCADIRKGLQPDDRLIARASEVRAHMRGAKHIPFVDVIGVLCGTEDKKWTKGDVCKLPVYFDDRQLYNVGYQGDGSHYSPAGSYFVGLNVIDKMLYGNGT